MSVFDSLLDFVRMDVPSDFDDFYDNISWETFVPMEYIYNPRTRSVPIETVRRIQYQAELMFDELTDNRMYNVAEMIDRIHDLEETVFKTRAENAELKAQLVVMQQKVDDAVRFQNDPARKRELGFDIRDASDKGRNDSGQFLPKDETKMSTKEKERAIFEAKESGEDYKLLAIELGVKEQSIPVYLSHARQHVKKMEFNGKTFLVWEEPYEFENKYYELPEKKSEAPFSIVGRSKKVESA